MYRDYSGSTKKINRVREGGPMWKMGPQHLVSHHTMGSPDGEGGCNSALCCCLIEWCHHNHIIDAKRWGAGYMASTPHHNMYNLFVLVLDAKFGEEYSTNTALSLFCYWSSGTNSKCPPDTRLLISSFIPMTPWYSNIWLF